MVRTALLPLAALLLASLSHAKEAKQDRWEAQVGQLKAQLEAVQSENALLKKKLAAAGTTAGEVPYVSTKLIVDSLGSMTDLAMGQGSFNVDLAPVYTATSAASDAIYSASGQAAEAASQGSAAAAKAFSTASELAQDLHGKHVSHHTKEYYDATMETYTTHVEPHVTMARKAYYENVDPYVGHASKTVYEGLGAAVEASNSLSPYLQDMVKSGTTGLKAASSGALSEQLAFLVQPRSFNVLGRTFNFRHGSLDMFLAVVQGLCLSYIGFIVLWKLFLKTLFWNIGVKFLGKKVCLNLTAALVKVSYRLTRIIFSILFYLVFTVIAVVFTCLVLPVGVGGGLGVGLLHGIEKNFSTGLSTRHRLGLGIIAGTSMWALMWTMLRWNPNKKKSSKADKHTNGKTASKTAPAKTDNKAPAAKSDAKQQAAKPTKKK